MEGAIFIVLCICAWKLWQIEKWLRRLRVNSLTPAAPVTSQKYGNQCTTGPQGANPGVAQVQRMILW